MLSFLERKKREQGPYNTSMVSVQWSRVLCDASRYPRSRQLLSSVTCCGRLLKGNIRGIGELGPRGDCSTCDHRRVVR